MDGFTRSPGWSCAPTCVNTLLRDTDAMSMRHSLEVRVPLLDHPLVEYVLGSRIAPSGARAARKRCWSKRSGTICRRRVVRQTQTDFHVSMGTLAARPARKHVAVRLAD